MAQLTSKQKFDKLQTKIIDLGLDIVGGRKLSDEEYKAFDGYVNELCRFKPSKTLPEDDIIVLHWFVANVYKCRVDKANAILKFFN